jgi:lipooligosaccharide transport system permease protein
MSGLLRIIPDLRFGSRRSVHVLERNVLAYRRAWGVFVSGFFEPLFYLLSLGIGLNKLIAPFHIGGVIITYATFVAPGMLATSAMNGAVIDTIFNVFFKLKISHVYDPVLTTPLDVTDLALGEVLWSLTRGVLYATSFIACMVILGDYHSWWVWMCLPCALLCTFAFSCAGLAACTWVRSWQDFDTVSLVQLPMFLFSGTFFPISVYPHWLAIVITISPLYQAAALLRGFALGVFSVGMIVHVVYLAAMGSVCLMIASQRFRRILSP